MNRQSWDEDEELSSDKRRILGILILLITIAIYVYIHWGG